MRFNVYKRISRNVYGNVWKHIGVVMCDPSGWPLADPEDQAIAFTPDWFGDVVAF